MPAHQNVIVLMFDTFQVRAFFFTNSQKGYQFERLDSEVLPQTWNKDIVLRNSLISDICQSFIRTFGLGRQEVFFHFIVADSSYKQLTLPYPYEIHIATSKDLALPPYFASAYFGVDYVAYTSVHYYKAFRVDNKNEEQEASFYAWKEIAERITTAGFSDINMLHYWLNYLIRPVLYTKNMYVPLTISLLLRSMKPTNCYPESLEIAGGEAFSWLRSREDILYPYVVGSDALGTFRQIYQDTENILHANTLLKQYSLSVLESCMGQFVTHIGDILTLNAKKNVKAGTIIGKVIVHDDTGYKTLYPLVDDILTIKISGIAKITLDLHYPFFMLGGNQYKARDILVIDTRIHERDQMLALPGWYTRLHEYDIY